jgi:hypothetical protein
MIRSSQALNPSNQKHKVDVAGTQRTKKTNNDKILLERRELVVSGQQAPISQ